VSDPHARIRLRNNKERTVNKMFVYLVTTTDGFIARVTTDGDPTDHPTFHGRVADVETLGEEGNLLSLVPAGA
jgi:hypothetical protein